MIMALQWKVLIALNVQHETAFIALFRSF